MDSKVSNPYSVNLTQHKTSLIFHYRGFNVPDSVILGDPKSSLLTFVFKNHTSTSYVVSETEIPTKEIRIFSASNNNISSVKVNTQINLVKKYLMIT